MPNKSPFSDILPSLIAGSVNGIICIISAMALSALVFIGPLTPYLPQGIGILLVASLIFALFSAFASKNPVVLIAPQDIPIAILALMAATIIGSAGSDWTGQQLFEYMFVAIGVTSVLVGVFFFILGQFKLGKLVRFIPFPVVGGFLAGTGWLIVQFSFSMMTELDLIFSNLAALVDPAMLIKWWPGVLFGVVLLVADRYISHYLLLPGILLIGIAVFYGSAFLNGSTFASLENGGYLLGPFPEGGLFPGLPLAYLNSFQWNLYFAQFPTIGTMLILNAISLLFNYSGLELTIKDDVDLDRELKINGLSNILAGLGGGSAGYMTLSESTMNYNMGVKSKLSNLIVAGMCVLTLIFGAKILSVFPKVILGGLIFNLGLLFLTDWLYDTRHRISKADYFIIVLILVVIGAVGFLEGIFIGLILSVILFVINYSKVEVIKYELSGKNYHSNVERSEQLKEFMYDKGDQIFILPLQGFIFFGTSNRLLERVQERLDNTDQSDLKYLIFNFGQVTGIDSSTINSFNKLRIMAENNGFKVLFCSLNDEMEHQFSVEGLLPDPDNIFQSFNDLDYGLEWCEDQIIHDLLSNEELAIDSGEKDFFKTRFADLIEYFEHKEISKDISIIEQGKDPGGIYFLESGRITVQLDTGTGDNIRLKSMGSGTVVGEVSLYLGSKASASVITDEDCKIYFLSKDNFKKLNMEAPEKAAELHTYIVQLLSDRLAKSNATIKALMR